MVSRTAAANEARRRKDGFGRYQINLSDRLEARIKEREAPKHGRSAEIERSLNRYYDLIDRAAPRLDFSESDWTALRTALHGIVYDATSIPNLWMSVADAGESELADRVRALELAELYALAERLERGPKEQ